jgi:DNA-binding GntR family transcriptional regulator
VVEVPWKYIQIADRVRRRIKEGLLQECEHDVARQTATKAVGLLARVGLLQRLPGIGYIVTRNAGREGLP